jgi:hypothetical protein
MVKEGLHERNAMLTENGNNTSDYDSSLLQLALRIEKNQEKEEAMKVETAKERADKTMRFNTKLAESSVNAACRARTDQTIRSVVARVEREHIGRKRAFEDDEDWFDGEVGEDMDVDDGDDSQLVGRLEDDEEVKQNNNKSSQ